MWVNGLPAYVVCVPGSYAGITRSSTQTPMTSVTAVVRIVATSGIPRARIAAPRPSGPRHAQPMRISSNTTSAAIRSTPGSFMHAEIPSTTPAISGRPRR